MDAVVKTLSPRPASSRLPDVATKPTREEAEAAVRTLIALGRRRPGSRGPPDTPKRVVKAYEELFRGYGDDAQEVLAKVFEDVGGYDDMVVVRDIPFHSHCEHHMVPFVGSATSATTRPKAWSACPSSPAWSTSSPAACRRRRP